jgi:hypothetical protein
MGGIVTSSTRRSDRPVFSAGLALVLANVIPLVGAVFWGWSILEIVALYWAENLVIGFYTVLRILLVRPPEGKGLLVVANLFAAVFFTVHYGMFCLVHGVFVFSLLGRDASVIENFPSLRAAGTVFQGGTLLALAALVASHGVSFVRNYLFGREYRDTTVNDQMFSPYPRIVVLHVAILFGAFAIQALGSPVFLLVLLVIGKTILDLVLHRREHRKRG